MSIEYKLDRSGNDPDIQRSQLNRILAAIEGRLKELEDANKNVDDYYSSLISNGVGNALTIGVDGKLFVPAYIPPEEEGGDVGIPPIDPEAS